MEKIELNNKTIFVTGAAGFIGSNLVKRLFKDVKGATIIGIDNMNDYYDVVLKEYITNPDAYIMSNMIGFYNILEACRSLSPGPSPSRKGSYRGVEHLVYASSSSVYGGNKKVPFSTDDRVDNPVSLYAATKKSNIEGSLPIGGLSSSAAVIISFLTALCKVNGINLSQQEIIDIAYDAELNYVGVSVGKLDQSCEVLSKKNHLLYLDTLDGHYELIPQPANMKPYKIAIFFSGLEHSLAGSKYNMRVDELRSGVYALQAFAGMEYGKFNETMARNVPREVYEQIRLYEIMTQTDGIYGGRFSGAGFKGCCMALIDPTFEESISQKVTAEYLKAFPEMTGKYQVYICDSADGIIF